jgi:hypothetical protein
MGRYGQNKRLEELGTFEQRIDSPWSGNVWFEKFDDRTIIFTKLKYAGADEWCWRLLIERPIVLKSGRKFLGDRFIAYVANTTNDDVRDGLKGVIVLRGSCTDWKDAVELVRENADISAKISSFGDAIYKDRSRWNLFRPFHVKYPWRDPEEPNAKYSPFTFVVGYEMNYDTDNALCAVYDATSENARELAGKYGANAFLWGPVDGEYRLYHRDGMRRYDVIEIEEWCARLIAGTKDD